MAGADKKVEEVENSIFHKLKAYGGASHQYSLLDEEASRTVD